MIRTLFAAVLLLAWALAGAAPEGGDFEQALRDLGAEERATITDAVKRLGELGDARAVPALQALLDRRLRADETGQVYILGDDAQLLDVVTQEPLAGSTKELRTPVINNMVRRTLLPVIAQLQLKSPDRNLRLAAADELAKRPLAEAEEAIRAAVEGESDDQVKRQLRVALARIVLSDTDPKRRVKAVEMLGETGDMQFLADLKALVKQNPDGGFAEPDADVRRAAQQAVSAIEAKQTFINATGNFLYGLSLGSVLLLAALGLAITFGLMGVINMAHGEMLMLGAYTTYVVQRLFQSYLPDWFEWYLLAAIPAAFVVAGAVGMALERSVIRHLYGRPLETLLATWGISLLLIQTVRLMFGAQNVEVANPQWLSGGVEVLSGLVLPYNRIAIVAFVVLVVLLVWGLLQRTFLGLQVRAVTQNRPMAASMGIPTARVDLWTFGLGSAVAGLGGVALSQLGNVGPELGQTYIVDSFMVVVLGGVGKLAGTIAGAMGLGIVNKFLEPVAGAVLGKIFVLAFIILFIQKRPQGLFALKGRAAEA